jgi:hypothetical protein
VHNHPPAPSDNQPSPSGLVSGLAMLMPQGGFRHLTPSTCSADHCTNLRGVLAFGFDAIGAGSKQPTGKVGAIGTSLSTLQSSVLRSCVTLLCCASCCLSYSQQHLCFRPSLRPTLRSTAVDRRLTTPNPTPCATSHQRATALGSKNRFLTKIHDRMYAKTVLQPRSQCLSSHFST